MKNVSSVPWYKEPWPWLLMIGPVTVIIAGVITTWIAFSTSDGLVEDDYYKQGLAVNQRKLRDAEAVRRGLQADVILAQDRRVIELQLQQATGGLGVPRAPLLNFKLSHPTRAGMDHHLALVLDGDGRYRGDLPVRLAGRWYVAIDDVTAEWRLTGEWNFDEGPRLSLLAGKYQATTGGR